MSRIHVTRQNFFEIPRDTSCHQPFPAVFSENIMTSLPADNISSRANLDFYARTVVGSADLGEFYIGIAQRLSELAEKDSIIEPFAVVDLLDGVAIGRAACSSIDGIHKMFVDGENPLGGLDLSLASGSVGPGRSGYLDIREGIPRIVSTASTLDEYVFNLETTQWFINDDMVRVERSPIAKYVVVGRTAVNMLPQLHCRRASELYDRFISG